MKRMININRQSSINASHKRPQTREQKNARSIETKSSKDRTSAASVRTNQPKTGDKARKMRPSETGGSVDRIRLGYDMNDRCNRPKLQDGPGPSRLKLSGSRFYPNNDEGETIINIFHEICKI